MSVCVLKFDVAALIICENEQEHRPVVSHREASHLLTGETIAYIDILISWAVTVHRKCCDHVPEIFLEPVLFSEYEFPNDRMEAVCSNHHVEVSRSCASRDRSRPTELLMVKVGRETTIKGLPRLFPSSECEPLDQSRGQRLFRRQSFWCEPHEESRPPPCGPERPKPQFQISLWA